MQYIIYKIIDKTNNNFYVGYSKLKSINHIIEKNNIDFELYNNGLRNYVTLYDILKNNDYVYEILEIIETDNKQLILDKRKYYLNPDSNFICNHKYHKYNEYYYNNRAEILKKLKDKYRQNKENVKDYQTSEIHCVCGGKYSKKTQLKHYRSQRHYNYNKQINESKYKSDDDKKGLVIFN